MSFDSYRHLFAPPKPEDMEYEPDPMGRLDRGRYVEREPRVPDSGWDAARADWIRGAPLTKIVGEHPFALHGSVGRDKQNRRADVFRMQALLHREGYLDAEATEGPTGYWGNRDDHAMRRFQKDNGLSVDGYADPDGETIGTIEGFYKPRQTPPALHTPAPYTMAQHKAPPQPQGERPGQNALPPVPPHKKDVFARPENQGAWTGFNQALARQIPDSALQRDILGKLYAEEGGRLRDPRDTAVGGITAPTLDYLQGKGLLPGLPNGAKPQDLTPAQQAQVLRVNLDDMLRTVGGVTALDGLNDPEAAYALAEALTWDGRGKGTLHLQKAINATAEQIGSDIRVETDGRMGPQTMAALKDMLEQHGARDAVLNNFAGARAEERDSSERERIDRTRPQEPTL